MGQDEDEEYQNNGDRSTLDHFHCVRWEDGFPSAVGAHRDILARHYRWHALDPIHIKHRDRYTLCGLELPNPAEQRVQLSYQPIEDIQTVCTSCWCLMVGIKENGYLWLEDS